MWCCGSAVAHICGICFIPFQKTATGRFPLSSIGSSIQTFSEFLPRCQIDRQEELNVPFFPIAWYGKVVVVQAPCSLAH